MAVANEPVWLAHPDLPNSPWPCPPDAVDGWRELGWEPTDERPVEVNPLTVEMPREMFEPIPGPATKPTKTKPGAGDSTRGSD